MLSPVAFVLAASQTSVIRPACEDLTDATTSSSEAAIIFATLSLGKEEEARDPRAHLETCKGKVYNRKQKMTGTNGGVSDFIEWRWSQKKSGGKEEEDEDEGHSTHLCKRSVGQRLEEFKGGDA